MRLDHRLPLRLVAGMSLILATSLPWLPPTAAAAMVDTEEVYADGATFTMLTPHAILNPDQHLLATASPFYVVAFPMNAQGHPILPPGYVPQCDPCIDPPAPPFHDHLLSGAPGFGSDAAARFAGAPHRVVVLMYSPAYVLGGAFTPLTDDDDLPAAEAAGRFLPIAGASAPNPYELSIPAILIGPLVDAHA